LPLDFAAFRATSRFASLDGVRGVAAVAVVLFHFGGPSFAWASGWLGVHVFFVLSGFLITTLALREEERRGRVSLRNFYVRRIFRIWPAYFAVLAVLVAVFVLRDEYAARQIGPALPWYVSFNVDLWPVNNFLFGQTWTIGIEQKFYLVWPLLAFLPWFPGLRRHRLGLMAAVFGTGAALWSVTDGYVVHYLVIAVGCLVAVLLHDRRTFGYAAALARPVPAALCWATFLVYHLAVPTLVRIVGGEPLVILGYGFVVGLIMPSLVALPVLGRLFGGRFLSWWGERSYSLYLVQGLAGWALAMVLPVFGNLRLLSGIAVVLASAVMADVVYRWIEMPGIQLGRRFTSVASGSTPHGAATGLHDAVPVAGGPVPVPGTAGVPADGRATPRTGILEDRPIPSPRADRAESVHGTPAQAG
jgi:peptidoglycan/LPS O-acetylase OafA/YrhL